MKPAAVLIALFGASAAIAAGGGGQQGDQEAVLGSRIARPKPADIPDYAGLSDVDRGRLTMFQFAQCTLLKQPRKVETYFQLKRDDPQSNEMLKKLASDDCIRDGGLQMPFMLLRGAIFRAAYLRQFARPPAKLAAAEVDFDSYLNTPKDPTVLQYRVMMDFADCVVRRDVASSDKMVRSDPASQAEGAAIGALMPSFGPCMVSGAKITLNRSVISAVLSEALYREASAALADGAAGKL